MRRVPVRGVWASQNSSFPEIQFSSVPGAKLPPIPDGALENWKTGNGTDWKSFLGKIDFGLQL
jgi:hypothetical protein